MTGTAQGRCSHQAGLPGRTVHSGLDHEYFLWARETDRLRSNQMDVLTDTRFSITSIPSHTRAGLYNSRPNVSGDDYKTARCIQRFSVVLLHGWHIFRDEPFRFLGYGKNFPPRHCPSSCLSGSYCRPCRAVSKHSGSLRACHQLIKRSSFIDER